MMNNHILYFLGLFLWSSHALFSQTLPPIQTDRPDQTECPFTVPKKHFQVESGLLYEYRNRDNSSFSYPSMLIKYGLNDQAELRFIAELVSEKSGTNNASGIMPLMAGFKVNLTEEHGFIPMTSFIGHLSIPQFASKSYKAIYYAPSFRFAMQHTISDDATVGYNLGAEWDGETPEPIFLYSVTGGFSITDRAGLYLELYGFAPQNSATDHRFDGGLTYLLQQNVMIDFSGGIGLTSNAPAFFFSVGFSFRLSD